jgi:hypothetical protein
MAFRDGDNFCKAFEGALVNMSYHLWLRHSWYDKFTCAPAKALQKLSPSRKTTFDRGTFDHKWHLTTGTFDRKWHLTAGHLTASDIWPRDIYRKWHLTAGHLTASDIWPQVTFDHRTFDHNWHLTTVHLTKTDIWPWSNVGCDKKSRGQMSVAVKCPVVKCHFRSNIPRSNVPRYFWPLKSYEFLSNHAPKDNFFFLSKMMEMYVCFFFQAIPDCLTWQFHQFLLPYDKNEGFW